jgi:hypothetical protein
MTVARAMGSSSQQGMHQALDPAEFKLNLVLFTRTHARIGCCAPL